MSSLSTHTYGNLQPSNMKRNSNIQNANPSAQVGGTHYSDRAIQPIEYINANHLGYHEGNIVKYITRYPHKNGIEDLRKALWYLEDLIKLKEQHDS